jgi:hypothetical protein
LVDIQTWKIKVIGPPPVYNGPGDAVSNTNPVLTQINRWRAMTTVDEGLKNPSDLLQPEHIDYAHL